MSGIAVSFPLGKAASCGDNTVKIHELHDLKDTFNVINIDDERGLDNVEWSEDGQLLAVSTSKGNLHVYLSKLPLLGSACNSRYAKFVYLFMFRRDDAMINLFLLQSGLFDKFVRSDSHWSFGIWKQSINDHFC